MIVGGVAPSQPTAPRWPLSCSCAMNCSRMPGWYRATVTAVAPQSDRIDPGMVTRDSLPRLALMASCIACLLQSLASVPQAQIVTIDSKMGRGFHLPFGKEASPLHLVDTESDRECQVLNQFRVDDRSHAHTGCRRLHRGHWPWAANAQTIRDRGADHVWMPRRSNYRCTTA